MIMTSMHNKRMYHSKWIAEQNMDYDLKQLLFNAVFGYLLIYVLLLTETKICVCYCELPSLVLWDNLHCRHMRVEILPFRAAIFSSNEAIILPVSNLVVWG